MTPGNGLILIWGRIFQSGQDLFLQTYIRFVRHGVEESIDVAVGDRTLKGSLSTQAFACAPRKIAIRDIEDIERQFAASRLLHAEPRVISGSEDSRNRGFSYWMTDVRGDWVKLESMDRGSNKKFERMDTGACGGCAVVAARADAGAVLRRGRCGVFERARRRRIADRRRRARCRTPIRRSPATRRPGASTPSSAATRRRAERRSPSPYLASWRVHRAAARTSPEAITEARTQFDRAAALVPQSSAARHLAAMASVAHAYRQPSADQSPQRFIEELRALLGTDPDNAYMLRNLMAVYDLVLAPTASAPSSWALSAADREQLTKQRESLKGLLKRS